jgi:DNA-directed RNA polymerase subunit RPC12/RpoP
MSKTEDSQTKYFCGECSASFLTQEGLETHFQRQHGNCESCPIDTAVQKITDIFRQKKSKLK